MKNNVDFTDDGFWTPQTSMLLQIKKWVTKSNYDSKHALSIDSNPILRQILLQKWPQLIVEEAVYPNVDAMNLIGYGSDSFDLVFSHQVLEHIPKPWIAAKEMIRVLKSGGIGIHTTCAFNPRHGEPSFKDYYRFFKDGLKELFDDVDVLQLEEWGNREAILYNLAIDDGHGDLGGRRFHKTTGSKNDDLYPWVTWIIFEKR